MVVRCLLAPVFVFPGLPKIKSVLNDLSVASNQKKI